MSLKKTKEINKILNQLLSDEFTLYVKTLNYHWNVVSINFPGLHKFFEKQYEDLFDIIDKIAERIRSLEAKSLGAQQDFLKETKLKESNATEILTDQQMLKNLLSDHEKVIDSIKNIIKYTERIEDYGTDNLLGDTIESHEKIAWMIKSSIKK